MMRFIFSSICFCCTLFDWEFEPDLPTGEAASRSLLVLRLFSRYRSTADTMSSEKPWYAARSGGVRTWPELVPVREKLGSFANDYRFLRGFMVCDLSRS